MDTIIIKPKNKKELKFMKTLFKRMRIKASIQKTTSEKKHPKF